VRDLHRIDEEIIQQQHENLQLEKLNENRHLFSVVHLNTQSMVSTFDEFMLFVDKYNFDAITLTETWLKDNLYLLDYVKIEGYTMYYHNRDNVNVVVASGYTSRTASSIKYERISSTLTLFSNIYGLKWMEKTNTLNFSSASLTNRTSRTKKKQNGSKTSTKSSELPLLIGLVTW